MKQILSVISAAFLCAVIACSSSPKTDSGLDADGKTVNRGQATGYATIFDDDTALARDRAVDDAKVKLVRKVLGETIQGQSLMKDFELVEEIVTAKTTGLVKNDVIIKQWQDKTEYFVTIEGTVEVTAVEDAIKDILNTYGRPEFITLITETFEGKTNAPGFTETEMLIQEIMGNSGFQFVDAAIIQKLVRSDASVMKKVKNEQIGEAEQELLLNDVGAEVIILGTVNTTDQSGALASYGAKNMKSKQANVKLKAVDLYTGSVIASMSKNAPGVHINSDTASKKAIENALKLMLGRTNSATGKFESGPFMDAITTNFVKAMTKREIMLIVSGLDYNGVKSFRENVSSRIRGVSDVAVKSQTGAAARMEIVFAGKTHDFADELNAKAGKMGFKIKITESYPNRLVLTAEKQ